MNQSQDIKTEVPETYRKTHSFQHVYSARDKQLIGEQVTRALRVIQGGTVEPRFAGVIAKVEQDLKQGAEAAGEPDFHITRFIADEMNLLEDAEVVRYLYHRYRYDVYPQKQIADAYPPYVNIEPSSACNYRCIFCYQQDPTFHKKSFGHMGMMSLDTYKAAVDQLEGNVEFISLASRGEPTICRDFATMLEYSRGKFLGLKLNTNASLLRDEIIHAILSGGVRTVVFSADAVEKELYSKIRVNGNLDKTVRNIERFQEIRAKEYSNVPLLTRVSGVMINKELQGIGGMEEFWGNYADQVAFVKYNPWDTTYDNEPNAITAPCGELYIRAFIWYNGAVNPCENDYKSTLQKGNILESDISTIWQSEAYNQLRRTHQTGQRQSTEPCRRCPVTI